jgi:nicotinamidase-related amidase
MLVKALLVIDVQKGIYAWEDHEVQAGGALIATINRLIAAARIAGVPVFFVQHEDEEIVAGTPAWGFVDGLDVRKDGDRFVRKTHGSAFHDTGLAETLAQLGVDEVVICGLQTEFCVDSTVRQAVNLGLGVTLVADGHSTFDTETLTAPQIIAHHNGTLASYVRVVGGDEVDFAATVQAGRS